VKRAVVAGWAWLLLAGCATRPVVVDAVSGQAVAAQVRRLAEGRLLVEANGYESRIADPDEPIALVPLWNVRFMTPAERAAVQQPLPQPARPGGCCPGTAVR
jgi:hypothetical protein